MQVEIIANKPENIIKNTPLVQKKAKQKGKDKLPMRPCPQHIQPERNKTEDKEKKKNQHPM